MNANPTSGPHFQPRANERTTAKGTVRRGLRASSPSGAAASKPMKARIANTIPRKTPLQPPRAWSGLKGARLRSPVFESSIQIASAAKTAISNAPRITPAVVREADVAVGEQEDD